MSREKWRRTRWSEKQENEGADALRVRTCVRVCVLRAYESVWVYVWARVSVFCVPQRKGRGEAQPHKSEALRLAPFALHPADGSCSTRICRQLAFCILRVAHRLIPSAMVEDAARCHCRTSLSAPPATMITRLALLALVAGAAHAFPKRPPQFSWDTPPVYVRRGAAGSIVQSRSGYQSNTTLASAGERGIGASRQPALLHASEHGHTIERGSYHKVKRERKREEEGRTHKKNNPLTELSFFVSFLPRLFLPRVSLSLSKVQDCPPPLPGCTSTTSRLLFTPHRFRLSARTPSPNQNTTADQPRSRPSLL